MNMQITGIKESIEDYNNAIGYDYTVEIFLNQRTGEVFTKTYVNDNNWTEFSDPAITCIGADLRARDLMTATGKLRAGDVELVAHELCKEYAA